ncbi:uncharacterized protein LOC119080330 isoform X2 [Bradysia coprophila]|uniref:uncharacterized protein LOC119080330 isoform X2 n=1 Tax=Bradysia coprophila TaxID=38358 RepID=UPI00187D89A4|nr:uncharacterized protein LOC119080330 isoform X2 [Bradysia coprophila]
MKVKSVFFKKTELNSRKIILRIYATEIIIKMALVIAKWPNAITAPLLLSLVLLHNAIASSSTTTAIGTKSGQLWPGTKCAMSEYTCTNGKCIQLNQYCDNVNDCGDSSDEPRFCTRCNRTYYGNLGVTYNMELHRPKEDKIPYVCELNFTAAGGQHGDIIQITLESFTLGRFMSYTLDGCPDGYLQIAEASRAPVGGMWCGTSWGPVVFYSETRTLILTVKLFKLAKDQSGYNFDFRLLYKVLPRETAVVRFGGIKNEDIKPWQNTTLPKNHYNDFSNSTALSEQLIFDGIHHISTYRNEHHTINDFQLNYSEPKYYLGTLIHGTYCSRIFSDCDKKVCRLQSPNYPGVYPRNLTCYYAVRQHEVPPGKHALITVRQPKGNLVWIQTQTSSTKKNEKEKFTPRISTWDECSNVQDYVTIYDGYTTRDPVILKFCGGGESVPSAISSGPELLVEFTTSPFGTFVTSPSSLHSLNGFQFEVEVTFVDIQSPTYVKSKRMCEFWVRGTGHGVLENPRHSLSPNTTCLYHLQGTEEKYRSIDQIQIPRRGSTLHQPNRFKVWISILKFDLAPKFGLVNDASTSLLPQEDCTGMLRVWDGPLREAPVCKDLNCERDINSKPIIHKYGQNFTNLIARYCQGRVPRSCDHGIFNETHGRPCTLLESYVSSSDFVTLELKNTETTVLRPLQFKMRYEFVDLHQDGAPIGTEHECNRKFNSSLMDHSDQGTFRSTKNIFMFGRGGTPNLKCVYRFEAQRDERVRIVIKRLNTGKRKCSSKVDFDTNRSYCFGDTSVRLEVLEKHSPDSNLFLRSCGCNTTNTSDLPIIYTSSGKDLELHLIATNMTSQDDPDNIYFEATFQFIKGPYTCRESRRRSGPGGQTSLALEDIECRTRPWLVEPTSGRFLYVRLNGIYLRKHNPLQHNSVNSSRALSSNNCETKSRVVLTNAEGSSVTACPLSENSALNDYVEMFSSGWHDQHNFKESHFSPGISVEYINPDHEEYSFTWMEMVPRPHQGLLADCEFKCPELDACVNASVWCDGKSHCPSGYDESFTHCSALLRLPAEVLATLCVILLLCCIGFITYVYRKLRRKFRGTSILQTRLKSLSSMDTATFDEKDVIC